MGRHLITINFTRQKLHPGSKFKPMKKLAIIILVSILVTACDQDRSQSKKSGTGWLQGSDEEKFNKVAGQLRGFDVSMVEVGYRYQELYWAGKDANWEYADYQIEKIRTAIEKGLERRPKRAASADFFLKEALPAMEKVVKQRDTVIFLQGLRDLTNNCNSCHAMEKVPFFTVNTPVARQSPIRK